MNKATLEGLAGVFAAAGRPDAAAEAASAIVRARQGHSFAELEDPAWIGGLDPAVLRQAQPYLTVRNGTAAIDPVTAPAPVLRSLPGMTDWEVARLVASRAKADVRPGSLPLLNDPDMQGPPPHRFAVIRAEALTGSGVRFVREAEVELRPDGETAYRVLSWRDTPAWSGPGV